MEWAVDVGSFPRLEELKLWGCSGLQWVTCSRSLTHGSTELEVKDCMSLVELPDLNTFPQLERLRLEECCAVKRLTCSRPVVALRKIELIRCDHGVQHIKCNFPGSESVGTANAGPSNLSLAMETSGWLIIYTFNATRDLVLDNTTCSNQTTAVTSVSSDSCRSDIAIPSNGGLCEANAQGRSIVEFSWWWFPGACH